MTTTQPRRSRTRWATAPFRAVRYLHEELTGAGEAMAGANRFPQPRPQSRPRPRPQSRRQPGPQPGLAAAKRAAWA
jgi:hypothetical protein